MHAAVKSNVSRKTDTYKPLFVPAARPGRAQKLQVDEQPHNERRRFSAHIRDAPQRNITNAGGIPLIFVTRRRET